MKKSPEDALTRVTLAIISRSEGDCCWCSRYYDWPFEDKTRRPDFGHDLETIAMEYAKLTNFILPKKD